MDSINSVNVVVVEIVCHKFSYFSLLLTFAFVGIMRARFKWEKVLMFFAIFYDIIVNDATTNRESERERERNLNV